MRVTVDTNFLVSATQWDTSESSKLLVELLRRKVGICTSEEILEELVKVLKRDFNRNEEKIQEVIEDLFEFIILVVPKKRICVVKEDPADNKIIECAVESNSEFIITYDKHLLRIKEYGGIKIVKPEKITKLFSSLKH